MKVVRLTCIPDHTVHLGKHAGEIVHDRHQLQHACGCGLRTGLLHSGNNHCAQHD